MPKYLKQNGEPVEDVVSVSKWIVIPTADKDNGNEETYLIHPRVLEYILMLEKVIEENNIEQIILNPQHHD